MESLFNEAFIGLSLASILLMVALGLAIIYGTMGVINLAHGQFVMLGAYGAWLLQTTFGLSLLVAIPVVFVVVALIGLGIERTIVHRLYRRPLDTILATWGIGIVIEQLVRAGFGSDSRYVARPAFLEDGFLFLGAYVSSYRLFIILFSLAMLAATWYLLFRTEFGTKLRAVIQNTEISRCYGISAKRVYALTFAYGAGLAAVAGALVTPLVSVTPTMGTSFVVDAFLVVIVGGVGSVLGSAASALMIGEASAWLSFLSSETTGRILILLGVIVLIRFRPQGLFPDTVRR
ncbi:urea ABC transporter permease subunit UrtB [Aquisalimonas lutea]|uniref:urea ABC transporter permease subunit UrtB n=1 Tax=Aquisalimonas lutea TaxID=1327750 RepID=UPI0025B3D699|nr:urea ABC transporter permease subunit UrtB [Aquisalimonas lutea]MDN3519508.1 urea ABC transporter permease subunit UrtB [Aquisalimonas lutea]